MSNIKRALWDYEYHSDDTPTMDELLQFIADNEYLFAMLQEPSE